MIKWALIFAVLAIAMGSVAHYVYDKNTIVAVCYDSSVHVVSNKRGSCSHHGGVKQWVEI